MSKENSTSTNVYEQLKTLYFSGKVKPSLNKIYSELEKEANNLELVLLGCEALKRSKDYDKLLIFGENAIKLDPENPEGYFYKGVAQQHSKGNEQEALKNFVEAIKLDLENTKYLTEKAKTHLLLFKDFHLPIQIAEKHGDKGQDLLLKVISIIENKENPDFKEYLTIGDVSIIVKRNFDAKKYYLKAEEAFENAEEADKDMNIYKEIMKSQKACIKLTKKYTE